MIKPHRRKLVALLAGLLIITAQFASHAGTDMSSLFSRSTPPEGIVFEIVDWEDEHLAEAIPWVNTQIIALREKYPGLEIAVVSHGSEQFALLKDASFAYPDIHQKVQSLITDHDIKLELCLGHAKMRGFSKSDFPDYVEIEAPGPSQIRAYEAMGYERVVVDL